jgi:hypothetical protein
MSDWLIEWLVFKANLSRISAISWNTKKMNNKVADLSGENCSMYCVTVADPVSYVQCCVTVADPVSYVQYCVTVADPVSYVQCTWCIFYFCMEFIQFYTSHGQSDVFSECTRGRSGRDRMLLINSYRCNQSLSPLTLWVRIPLRRGVLDRMLCDKVC